MFIYFIPFISALIGWLTNKVAIKMLFYPKKPFLGIHGLIPKRKEKIAKKIGEIVENELLSIDQLLQKVDKEKIYSVLREKIEGLIEKKFSVIYSMIPTEAKDLIVNEIISMIISEINNLNNLSDLVSISKVVEDKIISFDVDRFELLVKNIAKKEFLAIEICGAILGFMIGLLQVILFLFAK